MFYSFKSLEIESFFNFSFPYVGYFFFTPSEDIMMITGVLFLQKY